MQKMPVNIPDAPNDSASPKATLRGKKVLVVDDNLINLDVAVEAFSMAGAKVDSTATGAEAITLIERNVYDLLLLDLFMPDVDGLEVGHAARASGKNKHSFMLIFTASDKSEANRAMQDLKADGVIAKPVEIDDLLNQAEALFQTRPN
jgi:CheY-like chemotaxis protein